MRFDPMVNLELKIIIDQIRSLNQSIAELEETIGKEGQKLEGHKNLTSIKGIGRAQRRHSAVDHRRYRRLLPTRASWRLTSASCRGYRNSNETEHSRPDHQTRDQAGPNDAGAVRSDRAALQPVLEELLRKKEKPRDGESDHRTGS